jgi:glycosyltransferase involved in cell wall biosynthesis
MQDLLWLFEYPTLNGGERSLLATLPALRQRGYRPTALAPGEGPLSDVLRQQEVPLIAWETPEGAGSRIELSAARRQLADILRTRRFDLIHANSLAMGRLSGPVARQSGIASLAHLRDILRLSRQALDDLNQHTRLLAVSAATRAYHVAAGLEADKTAVLYNGVDCRQFSPGPLTDGLHRELGLAPSALLVGSIGQLVMRKGHDVLAEAAALLASDGHIAGDLTPKRDAMPLDVHFVLVGARYSQKDEAVRFEQALHARFATAGLSARAHFLGVRRDVAHLLREFSMLAHPARQEPLGRVLLEAAAVGLPVVATEVGGTREIFPAEENGAILVAPDDPPALASAMARVLGDAALRKSLGQAARRRARERFDAEVAGPGLADHYAEVLRHGTGGRIPQAP